MKFSLTLFALITLMGIYGCNRDTQEETVRPNDTTIERQDDYRSGDVIERDDQLRTPDEVEIED